MKKVLVCGGRNYNHNANMWEALNTLRAEIGDFIVVCGDARGADKLAITWAREKELPFRGYPAQWLQCGSVAGTRRNAFMLDMEPGISMVVSFPGGSGTAHMISLAKRKGIPTREFQK